MTPPRFLSRRTVARQARHEAAELAFLRSHAPHLNNGDEAAYSRLHYVGNYSKGLEHNGLGEVLPTAYQALLRALHSGEPADFEQVPLSPTGGRKFVNPQAGLSFDLEGPDAHVLAIPPAPQLDGAEVAAE